MPILKVAHTRQKQQADCLADCAFMALTHLGVAVRYDRLLRLLQVKSFGASFYNLRALDEVGVSATFGDGDMAILEAYLTQQLPVLTSVDTQDLPYWDTMERHVVLVVGIDATTVYLNDPAFAAAPQPVERRTFESAWLRREYVYGVIQLKSTKR